MSRIAISLFGRLAVSRDGDLLTGLEAGKVQELFAYILINRDGQHLREALASLLWGEVSTAQSKKYLRQTLWQLQVALESGHSATDAPILLINPEWLRVNPGSEFVLDIAIFEEAFALARDTPSQALTNEQIERLEDAVDLYKGELLEGCYQGIPGARPMRCTSTMTRYTICLGAFELPHNVAKVTPTSCSIVCAAPVTPGSCSPRSKSTATALFSGSTTVPAGASWSR
jgi:hypothetical protein